LRLTVQAGDIEINLEGAAIQIDEQMAAAKIDHTWTMLLERIREARENALEAAVNAARDAGQPDQVLGAIHYLRDVEGVSDSPPRVVNQLFSDAGIDPPGNLSLYLNRLKERNFLIVPRGKDEKNRFAILTPEGQAHLDKRSGA